MIKVLKPGFYTSVQDAGRTGYRDMGVPVSGAMDLFSATLANRLLNNDDNAAVLETTMTGPDLEFTEPTHIVVTGAEMQPAVNDAKIPYNRVIKINSGDVLSFGKLQRGFRAYLGIKDGFKTEKVLGSRSLYIPVTQTARIVEGNTLPYQPYEGDIENLIEIKIDNEFLFDTHIEVFPGPEYELLPEADKERIRTATFTVSPQNNRMAYQLKEQLLPNDFGIITSATLPGTVQLTPSGKMIVLMKDCQTTGGYPRILQLTEKSVSVLGQKKVGDTIDIRLRG
ncbi:biotin-dependent carboxyltransferase family protein [Sinomicrobium weinanense]|uniref:Biotin-dependent carboxyltransferase family protein n=1 Tax=Sinomicrobium weinanense TaxID=2842200 RepID=A0A926JS18_9FLAO|nr:biotin-dependent carboxyltransferase family protein [Sinomicrobium weinanense]MBC9796336.1 biotin-dependent carboxyltransferase family protein [Sinomicrobium weinanense]MBU3122462.1 biotin-dependent carboxyltransferase family protein [Sinomicrobium weinanense]